MSVSVITKDNFNDEVLNSGKPVLIDFWASWCGPCKMIAPVVEQIASENVEKYKICKVNVDEQPELAQQFNVSSIPTLVVIKEGKVTDVTVGVQPQSKIIEMLDK